MTADQSGPAGSPEHLDADAEEAVAESAPLRAELLPEEIAAGSADPIAQAQAILTESEERTLDPEPEIRRDAGETADGPPA